MNGAGWAYLAWDVAIAVFVAWEWRYRERTGPTPRRPERIMRGVLLLMAVMACVIVPIVAHPGEQPRESHINQWLTMPGAMIAVIDLVSGGAKRKK